MCGGLIRVENARVVQVTTDAPSASAKSLWRLGGLTSQQLSRAVFEHTIADNVLDGQPNWPSISYSLFFR
jgi:hypothetical protein